ncbi:MAG: prolyl oligopeptidase family serine peptidase [Steroidobacteraceae bacterium]
MAAAASPTRRFLSRPVISSSVPWPQLQPSMCDPPAEYTACGNVGGAMRMFHLFAASLAAIASLPSFAELPPRIPVEALFSNPVISTPVISADGLTIAYVQSQGDLQVVFSRPLSGRQPKALAKFDDPAIRLRLLQWANNGRLLISAQARSKSSIHVAGRETRMFGIDADGQNLRWLGRDWPVYGPASMPIAYQDEIIHLTPADPATVLISIRPPYEPNPSIMEMDVGSGRTVRVQKPKTGVYAWHADSKGTIRAGEGVVDNRYQLWARKSADAKFEKIIDVARFEVDSVEFAGFHDDPQRLYVQATHEGRAAIFEFDIAARQAGALVFAHPSVDVDGVARDEGPDERAIGVSYIVDRPSISFFDEKDEREYLALVDALQSELGFPVSHRAVSASADGNRRVLRVSSERQPPVFYLHDRNSRQLVRLFEQRPSVRPEDLAPTRRVDYVARDGLAIPAYLTLPVGVEPKHLPAIALVHGGPWSRDWIDWDPEVQLLANRGFAVLQMNFRGSTGLGAAHLRAGYREWGQKIQDDITDGVKWLIAEGIADPDRVGIAGASYGGYAALVGVVKTPELYRAAAAYAPVTDIELLISDDKWYDWGYEWHETMIGGDRGDKSRLRESSPLRRVTEIKAPVLIGHGTDDQRVHVRQSQRMAEALRSANREYQYLEFPDEIHGFLLESNRVQWYRAVVDFFDRNLAPRPGAAAAQP